MGDMKEGDVMSRFGIRDSGCERCERYDKRGVRGDRDRDTRSVECGDARNRSIEQR
jgi:hypothetical protein